MLQREAKQLKLDEDLSLEEIKLWYEEVTSRKRAEEGLYYDLIKVLEKFSHEEKREEEFIRKLEFEKLKLSQNNNNKKKETITEQIR